MPSRNMERFTQRARRVMTLAEEAAVQLNAPVVGSEHILLGLLSEVRGVASRVLLDLGIAQKPILALLTELNPHLPAESADSVINLSLETQQVIEQAVQEARAMEQHYVGTEHLLLGLMQQEDSMAVRLLQRFDIHPEQVRQHTLAVIQEIPPLQSKKPDSASFLEAAPSVSADSDQPLADMNTLVVSKVLDMFAENKLTAAQANELLQALPLKMTLTPAGKAHFASLVNRTGANLQRRVRITVADSATRETKFEMVNSLDAFLRFIDHFLQLVSDNDFESLVLDGDSSPITTELRIEKDEPSG